RRRPARSGSPRSPPPPRAPPAPPRPRGPRPSRTRRRASDPTPTDPASWPASRDRRADPNRDAHLVTVAAGPGSELGLAVRLALVAAALPDQAAVAGGVVAQRPLPLLDAAVELVTHRGVGGLGLAPE